PFTLEADFHAAVGGTAIARLDSSVVALLRKGDDAVAASGEGLTGAPRFTTDETRLYVETVGGAAVSVLAVAVVTSFVFRERSITAAGRRRFLARTGPAGYGWVVPVFAGWTVPVAGALRASGAKNEQRPEREGKNAAVGQSAASIACGKAATRDVSDSEIFPSHKKL